MLYPLSYGSITAFYCPTLRQCYSQHNLSTASGEYCPTVHDHPPPFKHVDVWQNPRPNGCWSETTPTGD